MKRIVSVFLLSLFLLVVATTGGLSAQGPKELQYPFFAGDGRNCYEYSTGPFPTAAGQVTAYTDDQGVCYWVSSVKLYGVARDAKVSFAPDWCPDESCAGLTMDFWEIPENLFPWGNEGFWTGWPLSAGPGTLRIGEKSWHLYLPKGEGILRLEPGQGQQPARQLALVRFR
jgi:hypothetical protein